MGRGRKKGQERLLSGPATAEDLVRAIQKVNPTGRGLSQREEARRYTRKSALQSRLLRDHCDAVEIQPESEELVALVHRLTGRSAGHALLHELDEDARLAVRRRLSLPEDAADAAVRPSSPASTRKTPDPVVSGRTALAAWDYDGARTCFETAHSAGRLDATVALLTLLVDHLADDGAALALELGSSRSDSQVRVLRALAAVRSGEPEAWRRLDGTRSGRAAEVWSEVGRAAARTSDAGTLALALRELPTCEQHSVATVSELRRALDALRDDRESVQRERWQQLFSEGRLEEVEAEATETLKGEPEHRSARRTLDRLDNHRRQVRIDRWIHQAESIAQDDPAEAHRLLSKARDLGAEGLQERLGQLKRQAADRAAHLNFSAAFEALCEKGATLDTLCALAALDEYERRVCRERLPWPVLAWMEEARGLPLKRAQAALALRAALQCLEAGDLSAGAAHLDQSTLLQRTRAHREARQYLEEVLRLRRVQSAERTLSTARAQLAVDPTATVASLDTVEDPTNLPPELRAELASLLDQARLEAKRQRLRRRYRSLRTSGRDLQAARTARRARGTPAALWRLAPFQAEHAALRALGMRVTRGRARPPIEGNFKSTFGSRLTHPQQIVTSQTRLVLREERDKHTFLTLLDADTLAEHAVVTLQGVGLGRATVVAQGPHLWVGLGEGQLVQLDLQRGVPLRQIRPTSTAKGYEAQHAVTHDRAWVGRGGTVSCWDLENDRVLGHRDAVELLVPQGDDVLAVTRDGSIVQLRDRSAPICLGGGHGIVAVTRDSQGVIALSEGSGVAMEMSLALYVDDTDDLPELHRLRGLNRDARYQLGSDGKTIWVLGSVNGHRVLIALDPRDRAAVVECYRIGVPKDAVLVRDSDERVGLLARTDEGLHFAWLHEDRPTLAFGGEPVVVPLREDLTCDLELVDADPTVAAHVEALEGLPREQVFRWARENSTTVDEANRLAAVLGSQFDIPADLLQRAEHLSANRPLLTLLLADLDAEKLAWRKVLARLEGTDLSAFSPAQRRHVHHLHALAFSWSGELRQARQAYADLEAQAGGCEADTTVLDALTDPDHALTQLARELERADSLQALGTRRVWQAEELQTQLRRGERALEAWETELWAPGEGETGEERWLEVAHAVSAMSHADRRLFGSLPRRDALEGGAVQDLFERARQWTAALLGSVEHRAELVLDEIRGSLRVRFRAAYDAQVVTEEDGDWVHTGRGWTRRDRVWEADLAQEFCATVDATGEAWMSGEAALDFLSTRVVELSDHWIVLGQDKLLSFAVAPPLEARVHDGGLGLDFHSGDQTVPGEAAVAAWLAGLRYVELDDGTMARLPEAWMRRHALAARELLDLGGVAASHTVFLRSSLDGRSTEPPLLPAPPGLRARLRPYQQRGWSWLVHRRDLGVGCVLADDMGLGKTLQAIALLLDTHRQHRDGPSLVVVPTSVLGNWADEIERFAPELYRSLTVYHGTQRALPTAGVVLTTHGLVRLDVVRLRAVDWRMLVIDEAQVLKNPRSSLTAAVRSLRASHRLALTGTPLENRSEDLWSLFSVVEPGLLGSHEAFSSRYASDPAVLHERIAPFLLRRRKDQVATDLPPKQTMVIRCTLSSEERELYSLLNAAAARALSELPDGAEAGPTALRALLRLRQACCHAGLMTDLPVQGPPRSSKLELLLERLASAIESGHRCLVFSQWTRMLDLVEEALDPRGIPFLRLDGSCNAKERTRRVAAWSEPSGPPVFLLSLKAGGVGLNLTSADHVLFLDPWWNPAAEAQAMDRAHRIGQTRAVMVYKLIAADTIEDRILQMQARKGALFHAVVEGGDAATPPLRELARLVTEEPDTDHSSVS